jgi:hypothetical protein
LLCDSIIGFVTRGVQYYQHGLFDRIEEFREKEGDETSSWVDDEAIALWLIQPLVVVGVEGTEMVRQLSFWTRDLKGYA